jgi:prolyl-tRNA synthetase
MTHGDDDGLRVPPLIAPYQIVIIPMLRDKPEDEEVLEYCNTLFKEISGLRAFEENIRVKFDKTGAKASGKRWAWVKKGAPLILEIGPRDVSEGNVAMLRRDALYKDNGKLDTQFISKAEFIDKAPSLLEDIQTKLHREAKTRLDANITRGLTDFADVEKYYKENKKHAGWLEVQW